MAETKFTPGPWIALRGDDEIEITSRERVNWQRVPIATISHGYDGPVEAEQQAAVHLIATAPELYELLLRAADKLCQYADNLGVPGTLAIVNECHRLLAKARGEPT